MSLIDFIKKNANEIGNHKQHGFKWATYKENEFLNEIEDFRKVVQDENIPETLEREIILNFYHKDDPYRAFIFTMMWGLIDAKKPAKGSPGDKRTTNFYQALSHGKKLIEKALKTSQEHLQLGTIDRAYDSFKFECKIPGVDTSYFTKILFFQGQALQMETKPLIYDKWTKLIHITLMIEQEDRQKLYDFYNQKKLISVSKIMEYYTEENLARKIKDRPLIPLLQPSKEAEYYSYYDYVNRMNGVAMDNDIEVGSLEGYLFGNPLKGKRNRTKKYNPRVRVLENLRNSLEKVL
jgi:hypothetical protein